MEYRKFTIVRVVLQPAFRLYSHGLHACLMAADCFEDIDHEP